MSAEDVTRLFNKLLSRVEELTDMPMESLHASNPNIATESRWDCIKASRAMGLTRGELVTMILEEEYGPNFKSLANQQE